jgi:NAD(P)-dependent dehydrogenase (short-subunit alcohol dehydrogenase family)
VSKAIHIPRGWSAVDIADQTGKRFLITGGTSGIGKEAARELARSGAHVTITARSARKGEAVLKEIAEERLSFVEMDLTDLSSVRKAVRELTDLYDVVILNAGIMAIPFSKTADGFETQMGTNHLGHFAFAGLIKERVRSRFVTVSSAAHRMGNFGSGTEDEIRKICLGENKYSSWGAYGNSKLANLYFAFELERRARAQQWSFSSIAVHPGYSNTHLQLVSSELRQAKAEQVITGLMNRLIAQSASQGALPTLLAATHPHMWGGTFVSPNGLLEMRGTPKLTRAKTIAYDQTIAAHLWRVSESLTDVRW